MTPVIHLTTHRAYSACGGVWGVAKVKPTTDYNLVTCKRCQRWVRENIYFPGSNEPNPTGLTKPNYLAVQS